MEKYSQDSPDLQPMPLPYLERFDEKLSSYGGNMKRAAIELAKDWRMDRYLRRLEAMLIMANKEELFILSGTGDVLEPDEQVAAIGSGAMYAQSAAIALKDMPQISLQKNCPRESFHCSRYLHLYQSQHHC